MKTPNKQKVMALCKKHKVEYHHHDSFAEPRYDDRDLKDAVTIVYPSQFGHWVMAINTDGKVVFPFQSFASDVRKMQRKLKASIKKMDRRKTSVKP